MFKCRNCGLYMLEPEIMSTTYGAYYGADDPAKTPLDVNICADCSSDELDEFDDEELVEELNMLNNKNKTKLKKIKELEQELREANLTNAHLKQYLASKGEVDK